MKKQLGFSTADIGLPPSEQSIKFSYKPDRKKDEIYYSQDFSIHEFKAILKPIIAEFTNNQESKLDHNYLIKTLHDSFIKNMPDISEEVSKVSYTLKQRIADKEEELSIPAINHRMEMTQQLIADNIKKVDKAIKNSSEFKEMNLLSKKIQELNAKIKQKHLDLTEEYGINQLNASYDADFVLLNNASTNLKDFIKQESNVIPLAIKRKLKLK